MLLPPNDGDAWVAALMALTAMPERRKALAGGPGSGEVVRLATERSRLLALMKTRPSDARSRR